MLPLDMPTEWVEVSRRKPIVLDVDDDASTQGGGVRAHSGSAKTTAGESEVRCGKQFTSYDRDTGKIVSLKP